MACGRGGRQRWLAGIHVSERVKYKPDVKKVQEGICISTILINFAASSQTPKPRNPGMSGGDGKGLAYMGRRLQDAGSWHSGISQIHDTVRNAATVDATLICYIRTIGGCGGLCGLPRRWCALIHIRRGALRCSFDCIGHARASGCRTGNRYRFSRSFCI